MAFSSLAIKESLAEFGLERAESDLIRSARELSDRDREGLDAEPESETESTFALLPRATSLFDYQEQIVARLILLAKSGGIGLVSLPTGAGKTRTAVAACLAAQRRGLRQHVVWVAPTHELAAQAIGVLRSTWDSAGIDERIGVGGLGFRPADGMTWRIGTIQTAAAMGDRLRIDGPETVLVFDEAHQAVAPTFRRVVTRFRGAGAAVVGLSATPGRYTDKQTKALADLFEGVLLTPVCLGNDPVKSLRARGVLAQLRRHGLRLSQANTPAEIVERLADEILRTRCAPGIGFVGRTVEAYLVAALLTRRGIRTEVVSHEQRPGMRLKKLELLRENRLDWLINVEVLATGIDVPALKAVALLTEIGSPVLYEQILGRVCRGLSVGGQAETTVFDAFDHFALHGDSASYSRFLPVAW